MLIVIFHQNYGRYQMQSDIINALRLKKNKLAFLMRLIFRKIMIINLMS